MCDLKIGDKIIYTGNKEPVLINPLHTRKGCITGFCSNDDNIVYVKFDDGTDGIIHIRNLKLQEGASND